MMNFGDFVSYRLYLASVECCKGGRICVKKNINFSISY